MLLQSSKDGKARLKLLEQSPLDDVASTSDEQAPEKMRAWVPSRFNIRATTDDGGMILWNTLSTAISLFKPAQVPLVLPLLKAAGFQARKGGLPGYLIERGYLVQRGTDEYRKFRRLFGQQHYRNDVLELILLSSEDCNFRCTYCYEKFAQGTMRPGVRQGVKRLVEQQIKHLRSLNVRWFGGEPLYGWAAVEELGPFLSAIADQHGVPYSSHATTNGYLLTPDVVDKLLAWRINGFQITLDGAAADHDCTRPTRDGQGSFATIHQNLRAMAQRKDTFHVGLRFNYNAKNHEGSEAFFELLAKDFREDSRFMIDPHPISNWSGKSEGEACGGEDSATIGRALVEAARRQGLKVSTLKDINHFGSQVCYAARPYNLIIGATGKVMKCTIWLDDDERNVVGHLHDDGRLELNDDLMGLWTAPSFEDDKQCQKCTVLPSCQGLSCPLPRIESGDRSCIPTRTGAKEQLFDLIKHPTRTARTRELSARPTVG